MVDRRSRQFQWHTLNERSLTTAPARLREGDMVQIGASLFVFRAEPAAKAGRPATSADELALVEQMRGHTERIRREVGKVIVGQRDVLDQVLMCILANGHALLIGLPGMAKTLMVRTIAQVLNLKFKRVQFTPDLMPGDIIGTDVLETNQATGEKEFRFIRGPIFCNLLLADEINRTPPKTQAALLEAMQEKMVTAGNTSYTLEEPFFVLATQNPIEQEGTYPLPEAQLDRFMFNIWVDYPLPHEEEEILRATTAGARVEPQPVLTQDEVLHLQAVVRKVPVSDHVIKYVTRLVGATRPSNPDAPQVTKTYVSTGAGPRAGPVPHPGRQGHRHSGRPHPRQLRRYSPRRPAGAAPPHPHQLRRRLRRPRPTGHRQKAARGNPRTRR